MKTLQWLVATLAAALGACGTVPPDGGMSSVAEMTKARVAVAPQRAWSEEERAQVATLTRERLARPLAAEDAVAIALLNNASLQAAYADLGIAEADMVQAGRLRNPGFSFTRLKRGDEREIERSFTFDVIGLITIPWRGDAQRRLLDGTRSRVAMEVVRTADAARRAWIEAVAAAELAKYAKLVSESAAAGAELAREMGRAGNFNRLAQSREQLFHADAVAQHARARHAEAAARERLVRVLGLWGEDAAALKLPGRLADPPGAPREIGDAEATAIAQRLDILQARREVEAFAASLDLAQATRFVNVLHLGYEHNSSNEHATQTGYEIELEIPVFDLGDAKLARTEAAYRQAAFRLTETAVQARSEVREAWSAYRTALDLARHYREEIVPLRSRIAEENLLRYNGMLIGVFELLADAHGQVASVMAAIEATRDFWIADANLQTALMTGSPAAAPAMRATAARGAEPAGGH